LFGEKEASAFAQREATKRAPNKEAALRRFRVRFAWQAWGTCWGLLNKPLEYPDIASVQDVRDARANEVKAATATFVKAHVAAVGVTEGLYLHILHAHAHQQVAKWGDLRVRQSQVSVCVIVCVIALVCVHLYVCSCMSQGLEHCHKLRKQVGLNGTNRKQGQRLETMLAHKHVLAQIERTMSAGLHAALHTHKKNKQMKRMHAKVERGHALMVKLGESVPLCAPLSM
jgi:hypothetical protein